MFQSRLAHSSRIDFPTQIGILQLVMLPVYSRILRSRLHTNVATLPWVALTGAHFFYVIFFVSGSSSGSFPKKGKIVIIGVGDNLKTTHYKRKKKIGKYDVLFQVPVFHSTTPKPRHCFSLSPQQKAHLFLYFFFPFDVYKRCSPSGRFQPERLSLPEGHHVEIDDNVVFVLVLVFISVACTTPKQRNITIIIVRKHNMDG